MANEKIGTDILTVEEFLEAYPNYSNDEGNIAIYEHSIKEAFRQLNSICSSKLLNYDSYVDKVNSKDVSIQWLIKQALIEQTNFCYTHNNDFSGSGSSLTLGGLSTQQIPDPEIREPYKQICQAARNFLEQAELINNFDSTSPTFIKQDFDTKTNYSLNDLIELFERKFIKKVDTSMKNKLIGYDDRGEEIGLDSSMTLKYISETEDYIRLSYYKNGQVNFVNISKNGGQGPEIDEYIKKIQYKYFANTMDMTITYTDKDNGSVETLPLATRAFLNEYITFVEQDNKLKIKVLQRDDTYLESPLIPLTDIIEKISLNDNELNIVNKKVNINAATSITIDNQTVNVGSNGNINLTNIIPQGGSKVLEITTGVVLYNPTVIVPIINIQQFTSLVSGDYSYIHLYTTISGTTYDVKYVVLSSRDSHNSSDPTYNDVLSVAYNTKYTNGTINYIVNNGTVEYTFIPTISDIPITRINTYGGSELTPINKQVTLPNFANKQDIIVPLVDNTIYANNQFCRRKISSVKKLVLSRELVPSLIPMGYQYSYADLFYWDTTNGTLLCNDDLYQPLVSGWQVATVKQKWFDKLNNPPVSDGTTIGQVNLPNPSTVISQVFNINATIGEFFEEWTSGDTGTPIWVQFDANGNVSQLSFTEIQDSVSEDFVCYKDKDNVEHRLANYDWKQELLTQPLILNYSDVFTADSSKGPTGIGSYYKVHIYNLSHLKFTSMFTYSKSITPTGWYQLWTIKDTFNVNFTDKFGTTHTLTLKPKTPLGDHMYSGWFSLLVSTTNGYHTTPLKISLLNKTIEAYYSGDMLSNGNGCYVDIQFDVELVSTT